MVAVSAVTDALREGALVEGDGARLEVVSVPPTTATVHLRLRLDGVTCPECVLARPLLEQLVTAVLRAQIPDVVAVRIDDPPEPRDG